MTRRCPTYSKYHAPPPPSLQKKKGTGIKPICDLFSARIYFIQLSFGNPSSFFSSLNALTIVLNPTQTRTNPTNAITTVTSQKGTLVILLGTKFDSLGIWANHKCMWQDVNHLVEVKRQLLQFYLRSEKICFPMSHNTFLKSHLMVRVKEVCKENS